MADAALGKTDVNQAGRTADLLHGVPSSGPGPSSFPFGAYGELDRPSLIRNETCH